VSEVASEELIEDEVVKAREEKMDTKKKEVLKMALK
jgi:hypothetical protein